MSVIFLLLVEINSNQLLCTSLTLHEIFELHTHTHTYTRGLNHTIIFHQSLIFSYLLFNSVVLARSARDTTHRRRIFIQSACRTFLQRQIHIRCSAPKRHWYVDLLLNAVQSISKLSQRTNNVSVLPDFSKPISYYFIPYVGRRSRK